MMRTALATLVTLVKITKLGTTVKKTTFAWMLLCLLICLLSYWAGYEVSQFRKEAEFKARLYEFLGKAMDEGWLKVNAELGAELENITGNE